MSPKHLLSPLVVALLVGLFALASCSQPPAATAEPPTPTAIPVLQPDPEAIFELSSKEPGTQLYYSQSLGVGFTYLAWPDGPAVTVVESGTTISILDQQIEVFSKDPGISLQQAIQDRFLQGYDPADCFVVAKEPTEQGAAGYVAAEISYPKPEGDDMAWMENAEKCPTSYSQTNGMQYFLMNEAVPGTFLFVRIGQYSAAMDGTPASADGTLFNWTHSIRILK